MLKSLKVFTEEKTTKDGRKFRVFYTFLKDKKSATIKFGKEVAPAQIPTRNVRVFYAAGDITKQTKDKDKKELKYPIYWINKLDHVEELKADYSNDFEE